MEKINNSRTININLNQNNNVNEDTRSGKAKANKRNGSIVKATDLNMGEDIVASKRKKAMDKAVGVLSKALNNDVDTDKAFKKREDRIEELKLLIRDAYNTTKSADEKLASLQEEYNIDPESTEQEELELLMKRADSEREGLNVKLTDEEKAKLEKIDKRGLTNYQQEALDAYGPKSTAKEEIVNYKRELEMETKTLQAAKLDRLKSAPMIEADKQADDIVEAASKEIVNTLLEEAKENVDEKNEDAEEKAEEAKEEKERIEALAKKEKEERDISEEIPLDEYEKIDDFRAEINKIVKDTGLSQEDLVGLKINEKA